MITYQDIVLLISYAWLICRLPCTEKKSALRHFAWSWKTFHKPNVLIHILIKKKSRLLFCLLVLLLQETVSQSLGLSNSIAQKKNTLFKDFGFHFSIFYTPEQEEKIVVGINCLLNNNNKKELFGFRKIEDLVFPECIILLEAWEPTLLLETITILTDKLPSLYYV